MVVPSVSSSWPLTHSSHCWLLDQVSPEEREEGHKVFKWGSGSTGREQRRAGLLGASRGPRSLVGGGGRLEVQSGSRRGARPVHRKWTCSQAQEAGSPPAGGKPGLEPPTSSMFLSPRWPGPEGGPGVRCPHTTGWTGPLVWCDERVGERKAP